jgi:hypothetical protein
MPSECLRDTQGLTALDAVSPFHAHELELRLILARTPPPLRASAGERLFGLPPPPLGCSKRQRGQSVPFRDPLFEQNGPVTPPETGLLTFRIGGGPLPDPLQAFEGQAGDHGRSPRAVRAASGVIARGMPARCLVGVLRVSRSRCGRVPTQKMFESVVEVSGEDSTMILKAVAS